MKLTRRNLVEVLKNTMFQDGEDVRTAILGNGVGMTIGFHPERLKHYTGEITELLNDLPQGVKDENGLSLVDTCFNKDGDIWNNDPETMDMLICLGMAAGKLKFDIPKEEWMIQEFDFIPSIIYLN